MPEALPLRHRFGAPRLPCGAPTSLAAGYTRATIAGEGSGREARAGRNQALFRALNEKLQEVTDPLSSITRTLVIACECADVGCVTMLEIAPAEFEAVRADDRRFVVLPDHVDSEIEVVVDKREGYVVVEKVDVAGEVAEDAAS